MKLAKLKSEVLNKALLSKKFPILSMYISDCCKRDNEGNFITEVVKYDNKPTVSLKLSIEDYFFNEPESEGIWSLAEGIIGEKKIDMEVLKIVEI